jgi:hypothetical protein
MKAFLLSTAYMLELRTILAHAKGDQKLFKAIVDAPFNTHAKGRPLGLSIVVLLLVNKSKKSVQRIALADTESAKGAIEFSVKPFHQIEIPLSDKRNAIVKAIKSNEPQVVADWQYLFTPALSAEEARFNQAGAGIATSVVYPLDGARDGGALIFSYVINADDISKQYHHFMKHYAQIVSRRLAA